MNVSIRLDHALLSVEGEHDVHAMLELSVPEREEDPARPPLRLALVLDRIPDLARWSRSERDAIVEIVRAKAGREEIRYLRLLQRHPRLRSAMIRLGSGAV